MNSHTAFTVYNAAAGAGKTYTLVKAYLITLLKGEFKDGYKNILAITFTNKAVAEMKIRVLENLIAISQPITPAKYQDLVNDLVVETGIDQEKLKKKADRILKSILHNYAAFDIVTIDTFTHRVIRTFAYDLGIPLNFEIEMDTEMLIDEAVDALISKIGVDQELTKLIIDFAMGKLDEDKSWDVSIELRKVAKLLFSENDRKHISAFAHKKTKDFEVLKQELIQRIDRIENDVSSKALGVLNTIGHSGIAFEDFTRKSVPTHFQKIANKEKPIDFKAAWKQDICNASFYGAKLESSKKESIDAIRPEIEAVFVETKKQLQQIHLFHNIIKNLTPLSVLNAIHKELMDIKKERKILLISEFNTIISTTIQDQPAPFIYERLGERYRDYFIDEFQDTSELQWNNLIPLVDNAVSAETLSGKKGQITIVGDAKQAIYRWRGGKAEQFINLSADHNPFSVKEKEVLNLPKNYRSHEEVIRFNNNFFTELAKDFSNPKHQKLYELGNKQEVNTKKGGYVNISFIEATNIAEENEIYPQKIYEQITELLEKGYRANEICIIVRKQKEGTAIADFLTEKGVAIISSETLLINNAPEVSFIIDMMTWHMQPDNLLAKINVLHFISEHLQVKEKHGFLQKMIFLKTRDFATALQAIGIDFNANLLALKPLYEAVEYIISSFKLSTVAPAYLQFFLDVVFSYTQKDVGDMMGFLSYWNERKDKLSIVAPEAEDAIKIMTIHKAKGLEFPCVIYPYANVDIYREIEPKTWFPVNPDHYLGFDEVFIDYSKSIGDYAEEAQEMVAKRRAQLELDAFNLLYVVLTRAKEQLYIISKLEITQKGESNPNKFSGKLISYLNSIGTWNKEQLEYEFGMPERPLSTAQETSGKVKVVKLTRFGDTGKNYKVHIVTHASKLWNTIQETAIEKGNLIHDLMASVYVQDDVKRVVQEAFIKGEINTSEKEILSVELENVVRHPELASYFSEGNIIYNERDIIYKGRLFRPDRIVIDSNRNATVMDYKTGSYDVSHAKQVDEYAGIMQKMGYSIEKKILIYFDKKITLKYI